MKLTQEQIEEIQAAIKNNDSTKMVQLKDKYNISGCNCIAAAKLQEFIIKNK